MNPVAAGRGNELKRQLARASIAAIEAVRSIDPGARIIHAEPIIHVTTYSKDPEEQAAVAHYNIAQYEALDLISGRMEPELGGKADYLDVVGVNFYHDNQWFHHGPTVPFGHHSFRPLRALLEDVYRRYHRPIMISETGAEGSARASWFHYVCSEVRAALAAGIPVIGVCSYPVLDYPGWDNDRTCEVGLLSSAGADGRRRVYEPLLEEIRSQQQRFRRLPDAVPLSTVRLRNRAKADAMFDWRSRPMAADRL
jgi:hypothetical protein